MIYPFLGIGAEGGDTLSSHLTATATAATTATATRVEAGFQSFGCLRDRAAAAALERSLRLDPATHPRAVQADSGVTLRFKRGADAWSLGKEVVGRVGGRLDALGPLPLPAPTSAPWEWGRGCWTVSLSLRGGSGPDDPPARKLADALDTIRTVVHLATRQRKISCGAQKPTGCD
jgi:hypothetical protein